MNMGIYFQHRFLLRLQVAATSRLAAYTAKAVAGSPSQNLGAAVSAAVAALAHNAAGATAEQDESATAAAAAAAAAAVEAVRKATGLKRQRPVLSLDTARASKVKITAFWVLWFTYHMRVLTTCMT